MAGFAFGDVAAPLPKHERELAALRATLELKRLSRQELEALNEDAALKLAKGEAYLETLGSEVEDIRSQHNSILFQLQEKDEKHSDLLHRVRREQEHRGALEEKLAKAALLRIDLDAQVRKNQSEKVAADRIVKDLQLKLRQLEKDVVAAVGSKSRTAEALPAGLEVQLEQLRKHLEDTVKVVQCRYGDDAEVGVYRGQSSGSIGARTTELSNTHLSMLETTSPCSSRSLDAVARSSAEELLPLSEELSVREKATYFPSNLLGALNEVPLASASGLPRSSSAPSLSGLSTGETTPRRAENCETEVDEAPGLGIPSDHRRCGNVLSIRDLSEIKTLKKPPPPIRMLMEICCLLFHIKPVTKLDGESSKRCIDYWEPARRYLLSDPFFPAKLRMYEASSISSPLRTRIRRYFQDPEFSAERVRNCSKAAFELHDWVRCLVEQPLCESDAMPPSPKVHRLCSDSLTETRRTPATELHAELISKANEGQGPMRLQSFAST